MQKKNICVSSSAFFFCCKWKGLKVKKKKMYAEPDMEVFAPEHFTSPWLLREGVTNFLSWVRLGIPSPKSSHTLPLPYLLSSLHASLSERYEGLPSPRCNPIKKSRNWFLILVRCCISPHLWEHTASIISHLITPRKNGYRAAVVSDARGQTCKLKSNLSVYLMYLLKIWK